jgi:hypothetical protein
MWPEQFLVAETPKRTQYNRDSNGHELCWHHPQLWELLPEKVDPDLAVPAWPQFVGVVCGTGRRWILNFRLGRA